LKTLRLASLTDVICDRIVLANFRLTRFEIQEAIVSTSKLKTVLEGPSLQHVENLHIDFLERDSHEPGGYRSIVESATAKLRRLQNLVLGMPLYLSQCQLFGSLSNLESITWNADKLITDEKRTDLFGNDAQKAKRAFEIAFAGCSQMPVINIRIRFDSAEETGGRQGFDGYDSDDFYIEEVFIHDGLYSD
jgi:hypothetical protein